MKQTALNKRGAALVELAISVMLLVTLVFGIIEFGLLIKDYLAVSQAAREGARSASLLNNIASVTQVVKDSAVSLNTDQINTITVTAYYRTYTKLSNTWSSWTSYTDTLPIEAQNGEAQVMIGVTCPHSTVIGSLFGLPSSIDVTSKMVARKE